MMLSPKNGEWIKMICIESIEFVDIVWGDCSLIKGNSYRILVEDESRSVDGYYLVEFVGGLCPHQSKYLKTEAQIRDEKINDLLN